MTRAKLRARLLAEISAEALHIIPGSGCWIDPIRSTRAGDPPTGGGFSFEAHWLLAGETDQRSRVRVSFELPSPGLVSVGVVVLGDRHEYVVSSFEVEEREFPRAVLRRLRGMIG